MRLTLALLLSLLAPSAAPAATPSFTNARPAYDLMPAVDEGIAWARSQGFATDGWTLVWWVDDLRVDGQRVDGYGAPGLILVRRLPQIDRDPVMFGRYACRLIRHELMHTWLDHGDVAREPIMDPTLTRGGGCEGAPPSCHLGARLVCTRPARVSARRSARK